MENEIVKEYSNEDITIFWKPKTCIHAAECVKNLPSVFKPQERTWIQVNNASKEEIIATVSKCPSGAISIKKES